MIYELPDLKQRRIAIGLLVLTIVVILSITVVPIMSINAQLNSEIVQLQTRLESLTVSADSDQALRPRLERLRAAQTTAGHHLKSETETVAAAELQRIVSDLATQNGAQVLSTQILPADVEQDFIKIGLRTRVRGRFENTMRALHAIEANPTFLFLESVSIRDGARRRLQRSGNDDQFETEFDVSAYMPRPTS